MKLKRNTANERGGGVIATRSLILVKVDSSACTMMVDGNTAKMGGGFYFEIDTNLVILKFSVNHTKDNIVTFTNIRQSTVELCMNPTMECAA